MATITDAALLNQVQYGVLEAPDNGATFPSGLWTAAEVLEYLNTRHRRFVKRTRAFIGRTSFVLAANAERTDLEAIGGLEDIFQIVRVVLIDADGVYQEIPLSESFAADHADPDWSTAAAAQAVPQVCAIVDPPTQTLQFMPASSVGGTVWLHYVPRPTDLDRVGPNPPGTGEILMVPQECALGIKWGVWADMLGKPGRAHDPERAAYAEARYGEIEELTRQLVEGMS